jgi:cytochrome c oxidase cbb3-type subunit 4
MSYDSLRHFADVWGLVAMAIFFVAVALFVFRPGSREQYDRAARIPLQNSED